MEAQHPSSLADLPNAIVDRGGRKKADEVPSFLLEREVGDTER
jgi:hypothetical protein